MKRSTTDLNTREGCIQWVLDFVQTDLDSLSPIDKEKLFLQTKLFCSDDLFNIDWKDYLHKHSTNKEIFPVDSIQRELRYFIETIEWMKSPLSSPEPITMDLPEMDQTFFIYWPHQDFQEEKREFNWGQFRLKTIMRNPSLEAWAKINFAWLIDRYPVYKIRKCEGCGKYFFNPTKREKIYCNSSCASRSIVRKKYEELKKNPKKYEAHLKKYRKFSRDRYERMRKAQLGPNVKIRRRIRVI